MKKSVSLLQAAILTLSVAACGTTQSLTTQQITAPVEKGKTRIAIERDESLLFVGAGAIVEINGQKIGVLGRGGGVIRDVNAGQVVLSAKATGSFGKFKINLDAKPGKTYSFVISPKSDALLLGTAFGMVGDAVHAQISDTSGYFQIKMVP